MAPAFTLTVELVAAARVCAPGLQKSLALPGLVSLCVALGTSLAEGRWQLGRYTRFAAFDGEIRRGRPPLRGGRPF